MSDSMRPKEGAARRAVEELMARRAEVTARSAEARRVSDLRYKARCAGEKAVSDLFRLTGPSRGKPAIGGGYVWAATGDNCAPQAGFAGLQVGVHRPFGPEQARQETVLLLHIYADHDPATPGHWGLYLDDEAITQDQAEDAVASALLSAEDYDAQQAEEIPF